MKATSAFKMSKQTKRELAMMPKQRRNDWKKLMKDAEVFAEWNAKYGRKTREKTSEDS